MGGRGSYSGKEKHFGPLGKKVLNSNQDDPDDMQEITEDSNPNYASGKKGYTINCQRCVAAMEARMQGYDVEALPARENDKYARKNRWAKFFGKNPRSVKLVNNAKSNPTVETTKQKILENMGKWGSHSRAVLSVQWNDRDYGHVMTLVNTSMGVALFDPQTAKTHSLDTILSKSDLSTVRMLRVDDSNLDNEYIKDAVKVKS